MKFKYVTPVRERETTKIFDPVTLLLTFPTTMKMLCCNSNGVCCV
jgi:hypothetical protein